MTKTIVIGTSYQPVQKPIEFNEYLDATEFSSAFVAIPSQFKYIELICKNYNNGCRDLMFAYDDPRNRNNGTLFIGFWNSGTVK
jgi:hypothetical protein